MKRNDTGNSLLRYAVPLVFVSNFQGKAALSTTLLLQEESISRIRFKIWICTDFQLGNWKPGHIVFRMGDAPFNRL